MATLLSSFGQSPWSFPKLEEALSKESRTLAGWSSSNSISAGKPVRYSHWYWGKDYEGELNWKLRFNHLLKGVSDQYVLGLEQFALKRSIFYLDLHSEWAVYQQKPWKISIALGAGIGLQRRWEQRQVPTLSEESMSWHLAPVGEGGVLAWYYLTDWLAVKSGLGTRLVLGAESFATFSAPYYLVGVSLFPKTLLAGLKERTD
jgi:hypothetical protein